MTKKIISIILIALTFSSEIIFLTSCVPPSESNLINESGNSIERRFKAPEGFVRIPASIGTFAYYLRSLPLKKHLSKVMLYNGTPKTNQSAHEAVVDLKIGNKNLQQCADAVIRLKAEYLFAQQEYAKIHFNFTNGFECRYDKWMEGYRVAISGNKTSWVKTKNHDLTYATFWAYLEQVFSYAGTLSLSKELKAITISEMQAGDVFIKGGSPGHAVIVVDMAINPKTGKKVFMLAQSYMPAQEIQILKNPNNKGLSPWYSLDFGADLETPEWDFTNKDLKRFRN
jgi:hypothetical protein